MLDIISDSKAAMLAIIWLFCGAISYMAWQDISRHSVRLVRTEKFDERLANGRMLQILHGDVDLGARALEQRRRRDKDAQDRAESYHGFKRYLGAMMP